ncbi:KdsC family phosphatase [Coralloluteibacterium stylophorae]|uniref:3-deoxy-D-manno-octulosonate 8-phosphate phosphatase KdsC n=1 Tax=Coralloluteibacterium stylophorae TaxID=1776034 RepID=A0A8J7VV50_9GAMM|nr:HAD-IIIA family hydrolase [Coralloluteibacterium stylophorae]MBS7456736.1 HAD-IIIA family hydrolase [Coralloluteibacterium stylophorae]
MSRLQPHDLDDSLRARAAGIRLAVFDVDGTLTDGRLYYAPDGSELKVFHVHDGLGLKRLMQHGIDVALCSARRVPAVEARARDLGIAHVHQGVGDKRKVIDALCAEAGVAPSAMLFMGDDLADLPAMAVAGLAVAPANAHPDVLVQAHLVTRLGGGNGAAREVSDLLLALRADAAPA